MNRVRLLRVIGQVALWLSFCIVFGLELLRLVFAWRPTTEPAHERIVKLLTAGYFSSLLVLELLMAALVVYFFVRYPTRRWRLACLSICHFTTILALPIALGNWSWVAILYPWPHTLMAFDPATSSLFFWISMVIGFGIVPGMTFFWGRQAFCGYVCPHGAFYAETYGRCFHQHMNRVRPFDKILPPLCFGLMSAALVGILLFPAMLPQVRTVEKMAFFGAAELFYFVVGIPLIGGRSYCRLFCPLGYAIRLIDKAFRKVA